MRLGTAGFRGKRLAQDPQPIFDAAVVVLFDIEAGLEPKIFLGRRRPDNVFLPDKWVFPGGRCEEADQQIAAAGRLSDADVDALARGAHSLTQQKVAASLGVTAVREVFEETGLIIGEAGQMSEPVPDGWQAFAATGFRPSVAALKFLARAITPPARPRRYDTRFFIADAHAVSHDAGRHDGEFTEQGWFTLSLCRTLDIPNITRLILDDACAVIERGDLAGDGGIPFYYQDGPAFRRDRIARR